MAIVKFEGKAIEKLIETVSAGIGTLYKPRAMRKEAEAEAYKIEVLAEANAKASLLKADGELEIMERMKKRLIHEEVNKQMNLENVVEKSIKYLPETVSEEMVDEDWKTRFFNKVKDISVDEMQELWAKILAEEITKPGMISLRTLDVVSNLTKKEAEVFQRALKLTFQKGVIYMFSPLVDDLNFDGMFDPKIDGMIEDIFDQNKSYEALKRYGINYGDLLRMKESGLILNDETYVCEVPYISSIKCSVMKFGDKLFKIMKDDKGCKFNCIGFTSAGKELIDILKIEHSYDYLNEFIEEKKKQGYQFEEISADGSLKINQ